MKDPFWLFRSNWVVLFLVCLAVALVREYGQPLNVVARSVETGEPQSVSPGMFSTSMESFEPAGMELFRKDAWLAYMETMLMGGTNRFMNELSLDLNGEWAWADKAKSASPVLNPFEYGVAQRQQEILRLEKIQAAF